MIETQKETIQLACGSLLVSEADFDISRRLRRLTDEGKKLTAEEETGAFAYFCRSLYPVLAAPTAGNVPDVKAAYGLPREELDLWWLTVWKLNADWFDRPFDQEAKTRTVEFRDGSQITLAEDVGMPSVILRLLELEDEAILDPVEDPDVQIFRLSFYPKMVACVIDGHVPPADVLRRWPSTEIDRWYEAVRELNSQWFLMLDAVAEEAQRAVDERDKEEKKSGGKSAAG